MTTMQGTDGSNGTARAMEWWMVSANIVALVRWLDAGEGLTFERALEIVERPWRWNDEYAAMLAERAADRADTVETLAVGVQS